MIIYFTDKFAGGRNESRSLLKRAIAVHTGDDGQAETLIGALKKGEHGKPYIEGFSCFSVSHTGGIWAVLVADCECGLDIQQSRNCDTGAIARRWFAPEDAEKITSDDMFFRVWTRREALAKALGSTVYDTDLPEVLTGEAVISGRRYIINDIRLPEIPEIYASLCIHESAAASELSFVRL